MNGIKHASEIGRSGRLWRLHLLSHRVIRIGLVLLWASILSGCGAWEIVPGSTPSAASDFEVPERRIEASSFELLKQFEQAGEPVYRLGPGDELVVSVAARPEISGPHLVGPDGIITIPFAGPVLIGGLTREEAASRVVEALAPYYLDLSVTVGVTRYGSNRIVVLGRVENPGVLQFDSPPNLLETLAQAGGLPLLRPEQLLTRCAVIRGDSILWVDVARLLTGDLSLNIRLQRNDIVYIPDSTDTPVYVLGEVQTLGLSPDAPDVVPGCAEPGRRPHAGCEPQSDSCHPSGGPGQFQLLLHGDPETGSDAERRDEGGRHRLCAAQRHLADRLCPENFNPFSSILIINQLLSSE